MEVTVTSDKNPVMFGLQPQLVGLHSCPEFKDRAVDPHGFLSSFPADRLFVNGELWKPPSRDELALRSGHSVMILLWVRGVLRATLVVKGKNIIRMVLGHKG